MSDQDYNSPSDSSVSEPEQPGVRERKSHRPPKGIGLPILPQPSPYWHPTYPPAPFCGYPGGGNPVYLPVNAHQWRDHWTPPAYLPQSAAPHNAPIMPPYLQVQDGVCDAGPSRAAFSGSLTGPAFPGSPLGPVISGPSYRPASSDRLVSSISEASKPVYYMDQS